MPWLPCWLTRSYLPATTSGSSDSESWDCPSPTGITWPCDRSRRRHSRRRTSRCGTATRRATGRSTPPHPDNKVAPGISARRPPTTLCNAISTSPGQDPDRCTSKSRDCLQWTVDLQADPATRLMGMIGGRLPSRPGRTPQGSASAERWVAQRMLGVGDIRLTGRAPNGQCYIDGPHSVMGRRGLARSPARP